MSSGMTGVRLLTIGGFSLIKLDVSPRSSLIKSIGKKKSDPGMDEPTAEEVVVAVIAILELAQKEENDGEV